MVRGPLGGVQRHWGSRMDTSANGSDRVGAVA